MTGPIRARIFESHELAAAHRSRTRATDLDNQSCRIPCEAYKQMVNFRQQKRRRKASKPTIREQDKGELTQLMNDSRLPFSNTHGINGNSGNPNISPSGLCSARDIHQDHAIRMQPHIPQENFGQLHSRGHQMRQRICKPPVNKILGHALQRAPIVRGHGFAVAIIATDMRFVMLYAEVIVVGPVLSEYGEVPFRPLPHHAGIKDLGCEPA